MIYLIGYLEQQTGYIISGLKASSASVIAIT
jgi:hypothetical protein